MQETSTARLVELTKAVGATTYFSGGGAAGYQENAAFVDADLRIVYQDFKIFPYGNPGAFVPGLSVLDWLMRMDEKDREGLTLCAG